ncbi:MAG TPA: hypothetical protein VFE91_03685, partial [Nitrososphaerales archaeon]|nr:hypothetical protein [Nitrososphaerales archaeon]
PANLLATILSSFWISAASGTGLLIAVALLTPFSIRVRGVITGFSIVFGVGAALIGAELVITIGCLGVLVASSFASVLEVEGTYKCGICGLDVDNATPICGSCDRGILTKQRSGSLAGLTLCVAILLASSVVTVPLIYTGPPQVKSYAIDGPKDLTLYPIDPSWKMASLTTSLYNDSEVTSFVASGVNQSGQLLNVTLDLRGIGSSQAPTANFTGRIVAAGPVNNSLGMRYAAYQSTTSYLISITWASPVSARMAGAPTGAIASFVILERNEGTVSREALQRNLVAMTAFGGLLVSRIIEFSTWTTYVNDGQIAFGVIGDYVVALLGSAMLISAAVLALSNEDALTNRLYRLEFLSPLESKLLTRSYDSGLLSLREVQTNEKFFSRAEFDEAVNSLVRSQLVRLRIHPQRNTMRLRIVPTLKVS